MHTIDEVLLALDDIIAQSIAGHSRQAYFATLYRQMTLGVQQAIKAGSFEDGDRMENLDVIFAKRYIDAWQAYRQQQPITNSWAHAFATAKQPLTAIQHLLLGINTHINLDLAIAAATTAPGDRIFLLQNDFEKINEIIATLADGVQEKLSKIWWPMKWLTRISNGSEKAVLNFSIQKARQASWANAIAMAAMNNQQQQVYITQLDATVLILGKKIESPGTLPNLLLAPVRWLEYKEVPKVAQLLS